MRTVRISLLGLMAAILLLASGPWSATAAPPWSDVVTATTLGNGGLDVVANARGDAAVVWSERESSASGSGLVLRAMTRVGHGAWSTPQTLPVVPGNSVPNPNVTISPNGEISVLVWAWVEPAAGIYEIRGRATGAWSAPERMVIPGQPPPTVTMKRDAQSGHDVAAWIEGSGTSSSVRVSTRTSGGPWSASTRVANSRTGAEIRWPLTAAVRGTRSVVSWVVEGGTGAYRNQIEAAVDSGSGTGPVEVVKTSLINPEDVTAAIAVDGTAAVGWVEPTGDADLNKLQMARRGPNGWSEPDRLAPKISGAISMIAPPTGGLVAGYVSWNRAYTSEFAADGRWRQTLLSDLDSNAVAWGIQVATDDLGTLGAAWKERRGVTGPSGSHTNHVRTRPANASAWVPRMAVGGTTDDYSDPRIAVSGDAPLVAWFSKNATTFGAYGLALRWIDRGVPTIEVRRPVDAEQVLVGGTLRARFACSDEQYGTGLVPTTGCVAQVERPDGSTYAVLNEQLLDTEEAGTYTVTFTGRDQAGNTSTERRRYVVLTSFPPDPGPGTDPGPDTAPGPGTSPGPGTGSETPRGITDPPQTILPGNPPPATPAPGPSVPPGRTTETCQTVRGVKLLAVQEQGRGARRRIRISGIAPRTWSGRRVDVRLGSRRIAKTTVRRDGTIRLGMRRPSGAPTGAYRLTIGRSLSNRVKASRSTTAPNGAPACR